MMWDSCDKGYHDVGQRGANEVVVEEQGERAV
jgi:hypothetical protein